MIQMCFFDADCAWYSTDPSKKITREQYFEALLAHLRGMRHPEDIALKRRGGLVCTWVQAFQKVALKDNYEPLSGKQIILAQVLRTGCRILRS